MFFNKYSQIKYSLILAIFSFRYAFSYEVFDQQYIITKYKEYDQTYKCAYERELEISSGGGSYNLVLTYKNAKEADVGSLEGFYMAAPNSSYKTFLHISNFDVEEGFRGQYHSEQIFQDFIRLGDYIGFQQMRLQLLSNHPSIARLYYKYGFRFTWESQKELFPFLYHILADSNSFNNRLVIDNDMRVLYERLSSSCDMYRIKDTPAIKLPRYRDLVSKVSKSLSAEKLREKYQQQIKQALLPTAKEKTSHCLIL